MNERIDQLAFDAGCQRHRYWDPKHPDLEGFIISQSALDKFAELIVQECASVIEKNHPEFDCKESADNLIRRAGRMDAIDEISKHFEVEL
jgi:hypothetical protein